MQIFFTRNTVCSINVMEQNFVRIWVSYLNTLISLNAFVLKWHTGTTVGTVLCMHLQAIYAI